MTATPVARAWALAIHPRFGGGDFVTTRPTEEGLPYEPLYDQAAINAAVAAERERCIEVCKQYFTIEGIAQDIAATIRRG